MIFLIIGVLCRIDIQLSQNWVSTVTPLCRCLLDKLRQSSIHTISKNAMQTWQTHYTWSYNVWHKNALHLMHSVEWMMHCTRTYNVNFEKDASYSDIQCGRKYYTRTYSKIFEFILYSDVQYDFWLNTILGRIVWFWFLYYTRTYSMIFDWILYSDV